MRPLTALAFKVQSRLPRSRAVHVDLILAALVLVALWFILCRHLSGEWTVNEQYNYGWFVPFLALFLFWLRWEDRPPVRGQRSEVRGQNSKNWLAIAIAIIGLFLLLPIRLFEIGTPEWRPLGWIHAAVVVTITLLTIGTIGGQPWLRHFAFPVAFFFVAVPWVTPIEVPIIQGLMRTVASVAAETAALLGIPAQLEGNLVRIPNGLVGVNEACSGVRSLQTSLMIGLLFGELRRLSILRRIALVAGAIAIALVANFGRAVFLVWVAAAKSIPEIDRWHDVAGYTMVGLVFLGSWGLAALLGKEKRAGEIGHRPSAIGNPSFTIRPSLLLMALIWIGAVEIGTHLWYRAHERNLVASTPWGIRWPATASNFRELKIGQDVRRILRFDRGSAASWTSTVPTPAETTQPRGVRPVTCLLYFFRWNPGRNSVLIANLHRPDVCLPAVGWKQVADNGVKIFPVTPTFNLPFRHFEFRHGAEHNPTAQVAHAFYCLWEDRATDPAAAAARLPQMADVPSAWTRSERVRAVIEGRRHLGQQVMELVIETRGPLDVDQANAQFAQALPGLIELHSQTAVANDGSTSPK